MASMRPVLTNKSKCVSGWDWISCLDSSVGRAGAHVRLSTCQLCYVQVAGSNPAQDTFFSLKNCKQLFYFKYRNVKPYSPLLALLCPNSWHLTVMEGRTEITLDADLVHQLTTFAVSKQLTSHAEAINYLLRRWVPSRVSLSNWWSLKFILLTLAPQSGGMRAYKYNFTIYI